MAVPSTPEEWLPILAKRLDDRYPRVRLLRGYANGNAPLPEMGANVRASWLAFQRKARTDNGGVACRSLLNRMHPNGLRIGDTATSPVLDVARRAWRDNRLDVAVREAIGDYVEVGVGYLMVGVDESGRAVATREEPEQFIADSDPLRPWRARAALKVWRDTTAGMDYARVVAQGAAQMFSRASLDETKRDVVGAQSGWQPLGPPDAFLGAPTVTILEAKNGQAFLEPHLDVIDRINLGKLNRLVTTAMQAYRQRALKSTSGGDLAEKDEAGNDIDLAAIFEPAPGALWDLPEGVDIWESSPTDITPLLNAEKQDAQDFAAATGTPISALIPDGQNQSATGADAAQGQQIAQAEDIIARIKPGLAGMVLDMLRAERVDPGDATIEVLFAPAAYVSVSERFAAAVQAKGAGLSSKTIKRDILGMTPDQIRQDEADQSSDALAAALLTATAPQTGVASGPVAAPA